MEHFELDPIELNDDELAAVAGGFSVTTGSNSSMTNSLNGSGNITINNSGFAGNMNSTISVG